MGVVTVRHFGLRVEKTLTLTRTQLLDILKNGYLALTISKNNILRDVSLVATGRGVL